MRVVYFGSWDPTISPRVRMLRDGLRSAGADIIECRAEGAAARRYASLVRKFLHIRRRGVDVILVGKPGQREMPLAWALGRAAAVPVALDYFVSLWINQVVERTRVHARSRRARLLKSLDRISLSLADVVIIDTHAHGDAIQRVIGTAPSPMARVCIGAEPIFSPRPVNRRADRFDVLFSGTFIPFHGIDTIVDAAVRLKDDTSIRLTLLGDGQEKERIKNRIHALGLTNVEMEPPIPYEQLPQRINEANLCLGIFGDTLTGRAVVPKKVYMAMACGRPVLTGDTEAIREIIDGDCILRCEPSDPLALAEGIRHARSNPQLLEEIGTKARALHLSRFTVKHVGEELYWVLMAAVERHAQKRCST